MSNLEPRIEAVRAKYDLSHDDFWQIPQNKQWVCKHAALEIVAVKAGIDWLPPQIIEADAPNLVTSMIVTGKLGERVEWATGETNATNYSVKGKQPAYPWAMSEKRAKDRVVLKLVGIHGLVYSEDELATPTDEPRTKDQMVESGRREVAKEPVQEPKQSQPQPNRMSKAKARDLYERMQKDLNDTANEGPDAITSLMKSDEMLTDLASLPEDWERDIRADAVSLYKAAKTFFEDNAEVKQIDAAAYLKEHFPGVGEMKGN